MNSNSIAWAAGFVDGEGCIILSGGYGNTRASNLALRLTVGNTYLAALERLKDLFGGHIRKHKGPSIPLKNKPCWFWEISSNQAEKALLALFPFLTVKKQKARLALDFRELQRKTRPANIGRGIKLSDETIAQRYAYKLAISEA